MLTESTIKIVNALGHVFTETDTKDLQEGVGKVVEKFEKSKIRTLYKEHSDCKIENAIVGVTLQTIGFGSSCCRQPKS